VPTVVIVLISDLFTEAYLTAAGLKLLPSLRENICTGLASVFEAKTKSKVRNTETWAQVTAQGAALIVYMCIFNTYPVHPHC
jgi:hypothetical protein